MKSTIPTTGAVLKFLVKRLGLQISKDAELHPEVVRRLAMRRQQKKSTATNVQDALIDAVAKLFAPSSKATKVSASLRAMPFINRINHVFLRLREPDAGEFEFTMVLVFMVVYFIDHHEWLCPQLETKHRLDDDPDDALRDWIDHAWHFYTTQLSQLANVNGRLFQGLPANLTWNLPIENEDKSITWPVSRMMDWWNGLLAPGEMQMLPRILFPNSRDLIAGDATRRLKHPDHPPSLDVINHWAEHQWKYATSKGRLSKQKLRVVLLWCRALQLALRAVERRFGWDSVKILLEFYQQAAGDQQIDFKTGVWRRPAQSGVTSRKYRTGNTLAGA